MLIRRRKHDIREEDRRISRVDAAHHHLVGHKFRRLIRTMCIQAELLRGENIGVHLDDGLPGRLRDEADGLGVPKTNVVKWLGGGPGCRPAQGEGFYMRGVIGQHDEGRVVAIEADREINTILEIIIRIARKIHWHKAGRVVGLPPGPGRIPRQMVFVPVSRVTGRGEACFPAPDRDPARPPSGMDCHHQSSSVEQRMVTPSGIAARG